MQQLCEKDRRWIFFGSDNKERERLLEEHNERRKRKEKEERRKKEKLREKQLENWLKERL